MFCTFISCDTFIYSSLFVFWKVPMNSASSILVNNFDFCSSSIHLIIFLSNYKAFIDWSRLDDRFKSLKINIEPTSFMVERRAFWPSLMLILSNLYINSKGSVKSLLKLPKFWFIFITIYLSMSSMIPSNSSSSSAFSVYSCSRNLMVNLEISRHCSTNVAV